MEHLVKHYPISCGVGIGALTAVQFYAFPRRKAKIFGCVVIAVIGAIYAGFALKHGDVGSFVQETVQSAVFGLIAEKAYSSLIDNICYKICYKMCYKVCVSYVKRYVIRYVIRCLVVTYVITCLIV